MAVQGGHTDVIRVLISRGYPVDDTTLVGAPNIIHLLGIDMSCNIILSWQERLTSLHIAAHCGHERVALLLLSRHAKVDAQAMVSSSRQISRYFLYISM